MKTSLIILTLLFYSWLHTAHAQFVTIPDSKFRQYLQQTYPQCMNGNQLDTTCSAVVNATEVSVSNLTIFDLTGIQYFDNLYNLNCGDNQLNSLPELPATLKMLGCEGNNLTSLPKLNTNFISLNCSDNKLTSIPFLPNLTSLSCSDNLIESLPELSTSLTSLYCMRNKLTSLPALPMTIQSLHCDENLLTSLPTLPTALIDMDCSSNKLTSLPELPQNLTDLTCRYNMLTSLPILPNSLWHLFIAGNSITCLPNIPLDHPIFQVDMDPIVLCTNSRYYGSDNESFSFYPNPATTHITLKYPDLTHTATLQITDPLGRTVLQQNLEIPEETIAVWHLPSGLYLVKVTDNYKKTFTQKLVINH